MKKVLIVVVAIVVILAALFFIPKEIVVERSAVIDASVEELQPQMTDFNNFQTWSPWAEMDPKATYEFKGTQGAVGAEMSWAGNEEVGTGTQKVTAIAADRIDLSLVFTAPWESTSAVYYTFKPAEGGTEVTWGYKGEMGMLMSFFINMDEMLGGTYEKGLATLKTKMEK